MISSCCTSSSPTHNPVAIIKWHLNNIIPIQTSLPWTNIYKPVERAEPLEPSRHLTTYTLMHSWNSADRWEVNLLITLLYIFCVVWTVTDTNLNFQPYVYQRLPSDAIKNGANILQWREVYPTPFFRNSWWWKYEICWIFS
jgi:hypothetical protein